MKTRRSMARAVAIAAFLIGGGLSGVASATNDLPANATYAPVDNDWVDSFINSTIIQRYYLAGFVQGRSYCVEVQPNANQIDTYFDPYTAVFTDNTGATILYANDDYNAEPIARRYSKNCFVWTDSTDIERLINIQYCCTRPAAAPSAAFYFRFRIVDTSLNGPWFFVDAPSSYNGFVEIANTTRNGINITVTIRNSAGATIGTPQTRVLPAYGNIALNARTDFGATLTNGTGSVQVSHDGAPGAIVANVTSLSAQTGLSFDSPLTRRQNW